MAFTILSPLLGAAPAISVNSLVASCGFSYWSANLSKGRFDITTLCSSNWRDIIPTLKGLAGRFEGYLGTSTSPDLWANPATWFNAATTLPFILTAATGCTLTFSGHVLGDDIGVRAAAMMLNDIGYEATGAVTFAWVAA